MISRRDLLASTAALAAFAAFPAAVSRDVV
jgi:hypothetical protein